MTRLEKIAFIRSSKRGQVVAGGADLAKYSRVDINDIFKQTIQRIVKESEDEADRRIDERSRSS